MADVFLAEQISLGRQVALKVLKHKLAEDDGYVRRFHNEARAAASLVHANIVQIHEVGNVDGVHYIAQEYVAGQNLKQWLARHGNSDAPTTVHIMRQVVAALHRASQQGIIHRDIKPENIMLSKTGEVKVADFGLARATSEQQAVNLTQVGVALGTPLYMSPEQVEGKVVDPRSDLYSLGVTCFEMLTGRPPFEGDTPLSIAVQHLKNDPERIENVRPDLPGGLCRIVHRLLAKLPADRYESPAELMRDLRMLHIEGLEETPSGIEDWDTPELLALVESRSQATQQLKVLMKSQTATGSTYRFVVPIVVAAFFSLLVGGVAAWVGRPASLLSDNPLAIERKETPFLQYWYAVELNTEEGWLSIEKNFAPTSPVNQLYANRAKQRLAEWYRQNDLPQRAESLYRELAGLAVEDHFFGAAGLIGQANICAQRGDQQRALAHLAAAMPWLSKLPPDQRQLATDLLDAKLREPFNQVARDFDLQPAPETREQQPQG